MTTSLPRQTSTRSLMYLCMPPHWKNAPSMNSSMGLVAALICFMVESSASGRRMPEQLERNADDRAEDERIFENVYDDAEGVWPFAAEQLKRYHCDGVEHRNDDGDEHNDRACVRAGTRAVASGRPIMTKFER